MLFINHPIEDDMILVPEDQDITTYGLESGQVKRPLSLGGGYPANLEVFHQLHCLVRSLLYFLVQKNIPDNESAEFDTADITL
jgi:hypothetical protein